MTLLAPIAAALSAILVLGGCVAIAWAALEILLWPIRVIARAGQQALDGDPHG